MSGDEHKLFQALQRVAKGQEQVSGGLDKITQESRRASQEQMQLARAAQRVYRDTAEPQEKYLAKQKELLQLLGQHKITAKQYGQALALAEQQKAEAIRRTADADKETVELAKKAARDREAMERRAQQVIRETMTAQERYNAKLKDLDRLLAAGAIGQREHARATRQARDEMERAEDSGRRAFGPQALTWVRNIAGALGLVGGVAGAVAVVRREYEALIETQRRAKDTSMTAADAQVKMLRNLGATTDKERDAFLKQISEISAVTGIKGAGLYTGASTAVSARGSLSMDTALSAIRESARLVPENAEEGAQVAGAALDIAKVSGVGDARANMAMLMAIAKTARVTDIGQIARNVAPGVIGIAARGDQEREAGALWSAITQASGEQRGEMATTGAIQLANQLAEFLPEKATYNWEAQEGGVWDPATGTFKDTKAQKRVLDRAATGLRSTLERIRYVQQHPEALEQVWGQASFEQKMKAPIYQVLSGQGQGAAAYDEFLKTIPRVEQATAIYEQKLAVQRGTPLQQTAALQRGIEAVAQRVQVANQPGARRAVVREQMENLLRDAGMGWAASRVSRLSMETTPDAIASLEEQVVTRQRALRAPTSRAVTGYYGAPSLRVPREPTATEVKQAEALDELLSFLRNWERQVTQVDGDRVVEQLEQVNRNLEQIRDRRKEQPVLVGPAQDEPLGAKAP